MDLWEWWPFFTAVVIGNAVSFAFFMAAMKCSQLQKTGVQDDQLPWWVYAGLIAAPISICVGIALLN